MPFNPKHEAALRVRVMLDSIIARHGRPDIIPLSDYADEATFNFLLPNAGWTFCQWHAVNQEVGRQLQARGYRVTFVKLELNEYFDFLTARYLTNTPENRAQFTAWKAYLCS